MYIKFEILCIHRFLACFQELFYFSSIKILLFREIFFNFFRLIANCEHLEFPLKKNLKSNVFQIFANESINVYEIYTLFTYAAIGKRTV